MFYQHTPVMLNEAVKFLDPKPGENFIDCTLGGGGYAFALAEKVLPGGKILTFDMDPMAISNAERLIKEKNLKNIILIHDNFKNLQSIVERQYIREEKAGFSGIVFDLGLSSAQLSDRRRGFSFQVDAPLNMAFGQNEADEKYGTKYIINQWPKEKIAEIIKKYGEENFSGRIAGEIASARIEKPIETTARLVEIISRSVPASHKRKKLHYATKTFQALRIATNQELANLEKALPAAINLLKPGGKIVTVSYHSLEDRIIKHFFKNESRDCLCPPGMPVCQCGHQAKIKLITKKVLIPGDREIKINPRARSAKMRVALKL